MSAGQLISSLFPQSTAGTMGGSQGTVGSGGLGQALANPQNIAALQNYDYNAGGSPSAQQQAQIQQLGQLFQQYFNPTGVASMGPAQLTGGLNQVNQAAAGMGAQGGGLPMNNPQIQQQMMQGIQNAQAQGGMGSVIDPNSAVGQALAASSPLAMGYTNAATGQWVPGTSGQPQPTQGRIT